LDLRASKASKVYLEMLDQLAPQEHQEPPDSQDHKDLKVKMDFRERQGQLVR
jgi:hypothetical protein